MCPRDQASARRRQLNWSYLEHTNLSVTYVIARHLRSPINIHHSLPQSPAPPPCYSSYEAPNMSANATVQIDRAEINRSNAQHSTGPRTDAGKQRSSQNALRHGLTARSAVIPSEDPADYQR